VSVCVRASQVYSYYENRPRVSRMIRYIGAQLAGEYFSARKYDLAAALLDSVVPLYREEAWMGCLVGLLRQVCPSHLSERLVLLSVFVCCFMSRV